MLNKRSQYREDSLIPGLFLWLNQSKPYLFHMIAGKVAWRKTIQERHVFYEASQISRAVATLEAKCVMMIGLLFYEA